MRLFPREAPDTARAGVGALSFMGAVWILGGHGQSGTGTRNVAIGAAMLGLAVLLWAATWARRNRPRSGAPWFQALGIGFGCGAYGAYILVGGLEHRSGLNIALGIFMILAGLAAITVVAAAWVEARAAKRESLLLPPPDET